jgi:hypothetical protein
MAKNLEKNDFEAIKMALSSRIQAGPLLWRWKSVILQARI